jgi:hypothetical protein
MTAPEEDLVTWARELARRYLDLPQFHANRWLHVQAVGAKASQLAPAYGEEEGQLLIAAAWLHDIGYAPVLALTKFHPLDGARFLARLGAERIAGLIAYHSGAIREAELRGLDKDLAEFTDEGGPVRDALWCCDMTTSPVGQPVPFTNRLAEIRERYGADHVVPRAISAAASDIRLAIRATRESVAAAGIKVELHE